MTRLHPNLLVHSKGDHAGVAIDGFKMGDRARGVVLADRSQFELDARQDIPPGHKMAVKAVDQGETIILYGQPVGAATQAIKAGEHMHTHNIKSLRWS
jgi:(2R)-sulfolactate sulfo-lyase subunit alpha